MLASRPHATQLELSHFCSRTPPNVWPVGRPHLFKTIFHDAIKRKGFEINHLLKSVASPATPMTKMQGNAQSTARHERWQGSCAPLHFGRGEGRAAALLVRCLLFKQLRRNLAVSSGASKPPGTHAGLPYFALVHALLRPIMAASSQPM